MSYDLKDVDGQLDRGKVIAALDEILAIDTSSAGRLTQIKKQIIGLMDEATDVAFMAGMEF
jgi:hypothetical protein